MRLSVSFGTGYDLGPFRRNMLRKLERGAQRATDRAALGARDDIRRAMRGQRLANLANAVKQTSDLKKGRVRPLPNGGFSVSGVVYAHVRSERTKGALEAYTEGAQIIPKKGRWLAIAMPDIPRLVGRKRMTPALYNEAGYDQRIGPLRFIQSRKPNLAFLVVEDTTRSPYRSGSAKRPPKSRLRSGARERVGIIAFTLIKATRRQRRVDVRAIAAQWQRQVGSLMYREMG